MNVRREANGGPRAAAKGLVSPQQTRKHGRTFCYWRRELSKVSCQAAGSRGEVDLCGVFLKSETSFWFDFTLLDVFLGENFPLNLSRI